MLLRNVHLQFDQGEGSRRWHFRLRQFLCGNVRIRDNNRQWVRTVAQGDMVQKTMKSLVQHL